MAGCVRLDAPHRKSIPWSGDFFISVRAEMLYSKIALELKLIIVTHTGLFKL